MRNIEEIKALPFEKRIEVLCEIIDNGKTIGEDFKIFQKEFEFIRSGNLYRITLFENGVEVGSELSHTKEVVLPAIKIIDRISNGVYIHPKKSRIIYPSEIVVEGDTIVIPVDKKFTYTVELNIE